MHTSVFKALIFSVILLNFKALLGLLFQPFYQTNQYFSSEEEVIKNIMGKKTKIEFPHYLPGFAD